MAWESLEQIRSAFQLGEIGNDRAAVRAALISLRSARHPDRNGGRFESKAEEESFQELADAIVFCDKATNNALVASQDAHRYAMIVRAELARAREPTLVEERAEYRALAASESHDRALIPRIGSGVFAAASIGLISFSGQLKDNPLFGQLLYPRYGQSVLWIVLLSSSALFLLTWWREQRQNERDDWLTTDAGRQAILAEVISQNRDVLLRGRFTFSQLVETIRILSGGHRLDKHRSSFALRLAYPLGRPGLTQSAAEALARMHLAELDRRGLLTQVPDALFDLAYDLHGSVLSQLSLLPALMNDATDQ